MSDRPGDDDSSASDWLSAQFGETDEGGKPPAATPTPQPEAAPEDAAAPPAATPTEAAAPGFAWGLTPAAPTPAPEPRRPVTPAPVEPPVEPVIPAGGLTPAFLPQTPATPPPVTAAPSSRPLPTPPLPELVVPEPVVPEQVVPQAASPAPPPLIEPTPPAAWTPPQPPAPAAEQPPSWEQPTQLIESVPEPAAPAAPTEVFAAPRTAAPTQVFGAAPSADPAPASAVDALFGEQNFRDYDADALAAQPLAPRGAHEAPTDGGGGNGRTQKVLLGVVGALVAVLALVALFLLGTRLPALIGPAPAASPSTSPSPSPSPSPTPEPVGPVAVGTWAWDELRGGECLDPFTGPWAEEYTVVDCAVPHPAQLVVRGVIPPSAEGVTDDAFPGVEALQAQLALLCNAPGVVDLAVASQYPDVQFLGSYPATQAQWDDGERSYFCFVTRSSGEPFTASIAVPPTPQAAG